MSGATKHRSYTEKLLTSRRRRAFALKIIGFILAAVLFRTFIMQSYRVNTSDMEPAFTKGDLLLVAPFSDGATTFLGKLPPLVAPQRGRLAVILPDTPPTESRWFLAWDAIVRFFTLQRVSARELRYGKNLSQPILARIIAIPGDTVRANGLLYEIKPAGQDIFLPEYSVSAYEYSISGALETQAGTSEEHRTTQQKRIVLKANQYFVACDTRASFSGSELLGLIGADRLAGRIVLTFWPLAHASLP